MVDALSEVTQGACAAPASLKADSGSDGWPSATAVDELKAKEIHVWAVSLLATEPELNAISAALSDDEIARAGRFYFDRDRNRFVVARYSLRQVLSEYLETSPQRIMFEYGWRNKPRLAGEFADTLHFNLSHSDDLALLAVTRLAPVGVDVERLRDLPDAEQLVARFFSARENRLFRQVPKVQRQRVFYNLWTRKEAWLKATGEGISDSLRLVEVTLLPDERAALVGLPADSGDPEDWTLEHLEPSAGFVGALACRAKPSGLRCRKFQRFA